MKNKTILILFVFLIFSCGKKETSHTNPLELVLASDSPNLKRVMSNLEKHEVQIQFTQIERKNGQVNFKDYNFQVDSANYFYPASTVKFPIAMLTLAKLNTLKEIDKDSKFYIEGDSVTTTFAKEIQKIFAVSDNVAYNRLFEFLGQDYINEELRKIGIGSVRIAHRLSAPEAHEITTKPLIVYLNDSTTTTLPPTINTTAESLVLNAIEKGKGYIEEDSLMGTPFDFSLKNYYPIETQHRFLKTVLFPELYQSNEKIVLEDAQLEFIQNAMHTVPRKIGYNAETYYDGYCKFFIYGDTKENIPEHIKIYNKVGDAYGTLTDSAYIHDSKNNVEFLLTATILVNKNGVYNDNNYEYDDIGFPFLAELGRALYNYEMNR